MLVPLRDVRVGQPLARDSFAPAVASDDAPRVG